MWSNTNQHISEIIEIFSTFPDLVPSQILIQSITSELQWTIA